MTELSDNEKYVFVKGFGPGIITQIKAHPTLCTQHLYTIRLPHCNDAIVTTEAVNCCNEVEVSIHTFHQFTRPLTRPRKSYEQTINSSTQTTADEDEDSVTQFIEPPQTFTFSIAMHDTFCTTLFDTLLDLYMAHGVDYLSMTDLTLVHNGMKFDVLNDELKSKSTWQLSQLREYKQRSTLNEAVVVAPLQSPKTPTCNLQSKRTFPLQSSPLSTKSHSHKPFCPIIRMLLIYTPQTQFTWNVPASQQQQFKVSSDGVTLTNLQDNKWSTIRCSTSLQELWSRCHLPQAHILSWKLEFVRCSSSNVFIGIWNGSGKSVNNYLGSDSSGYGLYAAGNIYHAGKSNKFGQQIQFKQGDTITVTLDCKKRQLSFSKNDTQRLGVAFDNMNWCDEKHQSESEQSAEFEVEWFPAVSLYSKNDTIKLIAFDEDTVL